MSSTYERVVAVVSKPPGERTENEADGLMPWFRKKSDLFANLKAEIVKDIIKNCEFRTVPMDTVIIRQAEKGDCFYIILNGKVSIYINNSLADDEEGATIDPSGVGEDKLDRTKLGSFIAYIDAGKSFGELALINKDCVRNASIVSDELTDLLVVNRELYNRSLHAEQAAEFEARTKFVQMNPLFRNWQLRYKKQMAMSIRRVVTQFDEHIIHQADTVNALYFIVGGEAKLIIDPEQHSSQYPNLLEQVEEAQHENSKHTSERGSSLAVPHARRREGRRRSIVEMCVVGENEVIGDTEFALDLKTYTLSVVSTQVCQLYALDMKNYERLVVKRNPKTVEHIRDGALLKLEGRVTRMPNTIPLLKALMQKLNDLLNPPKKYQKEKTEVTLRSSTLDFPRGPLIDQYGPGTAFGRIREREQAKKRAQYKNKLLRGGKDQVNESTIHNIVNSLGEPPSIVDTYHDEYSHGIHGDGVSLVDTNSQQNGEETSKKPYKDWETSDRVLTDLEDRLSAWHADCADGVSRSNKSNPAKMKRVSLDKGHKLTPGAKIVMRRRQPRFLNGHEHNGDEAKNFKENTPANSFHKHNNRISTDEQTTNLNDDCFLDDVTNQVTFQRDHLTKCEQLHDSTKTFVTVPEDDDQNNFSVNNSEDSLITSARNEAMTSSKERGISILQPPSNQFFMNPKLDEPRLSELRVPHFGFPKLSMINEEKLNHQQQPAEVHLPRVSKSASHFDVKPPNHKLRIICEQFKRYKEFTKVRSTSADVNMKTFRMSALGLKFKP